ncbi:phage virion morphogenesis protein [Terasakiella pusilla]|uniref:phage virion morphogenesis protein n=1 Tax=Terasakiella pusilla TaxID=64973 RepID=UPI003AA8F5FA
MNSGVSAFWRGEGALAAELKLLTLPRARRKRALGQIGREVKKQARKNVRNQRNIRGEAFQKRRKERTREGEMLSGFVKGSNIRQRSREMSVTVGFKNDVMSRMAAAHQEGQTQTIRARPMSEKQKSDWRNEPASQAQANAILRLGWSTSRRRDGKRKKISRKYIKENLTKLQALGLLHELNGRRQGKKSWKTKLPAREFFPNDAQWVKQMAFEVITKELNRGN